MLVARLISPAVRSERKEELIQSIHDCLDPTAGGAVSTIEHPGDGALGGALAPPGARVLLAPACKRLTSDGRRVVDAHARASRTDCRYRRRQDCLLPRQFPPFGYILTTSSNSNCTWLFSSVTDRTSTAQYYHPILATPPPSPLMYILTISNSVCNILIYTYINI